jgi:aminopeptidase YwaD
METRPGRLLATLMLVAAVAAPGCSNDNHANGNNANGNNVAPYDDPEAVGERLLTTLEELAAYGQKRAGTPAGQQAAQYIRDRMTAAGLSDVRFEEFGFLSFELESSALTVTADSTELPMAHDVFAYSGAGSVDATLVYVGKGHPEDYAGIDTNGKVVLVERDETYHRSAQYRFVIENGGAAMVYVSQAPDNLIQIGTVADPEDGLGPIPALTVGADDGQRILDALDAGHRVRVAASVSAVVVPATGRNVVGELPGEDPSGAYFLVGGHYDTWFTGSVDNTTGVAATLEIAESLALRGPRSYGLVFVAYDAEELGLFGGYDFLRRHVVVGGEPLLAFVNFEMPANSADDGLRALAYTNGAGLYDVITDAEAQQLYWFLAGLELVPGLFGGSIPTDIQGLYWYGLQGMTTACQSAWYHTTEDTPDKVDIPFFADAVLRVQQILAALDEKDLADFDVHDREVWRIDVATTPAGCDLHGEITVTDADGQPQADATVRLWLDVDDFTRVHEDTGTTDAAGQLDLTVGADALAEGAGGRWLHITASDEHPLAETILPLP